MFTKEYKMFTFTDALIIAAEAHRNIKDQGGVDYIKHPLHIAHQLKIKGYSNETQITGLLHDVVEDTDVTFETLISKGAPESVIEALKLLTHIPDVKFIMSKFDYYVENGEDLALAKIKAKEDEYIRYIVRLSVNDIARSVKIEDLIHNSDISRVNDSDLENPYVGRRFLKYAKARRILTGGKVGYN
jgi:guanosine-3',5'-bis(diphosphate) 3'-pyrophosphohydrolase